MSQRSGRDAASVRGHNLRTLLEYVHRYGPTTRAQLVEITGLTRSAVGDLVSELSAREFLVESSAPGGGARGRPSLIVACADGAKVLAISIREETLRARWVGLGGTAGAVIEEPHEYVPDDPRPSVDQLVELICSQLDASDVRPLAIGFAVPGLVSATDGVVMLEPRLGWRNLSLAKEVRRRTGLEVPVVAGNDSNLAALAEHLRGAGSGDSSMIYLEGGLGVGGGIIYNDRPIFTTSQSASGIGHMVTDSDGLECYCGGRGCWQTQVGGEALLLHAGIADLNLRDGRAELSALLIRAERGDPAALAALAALVPAIATGIATLIAVVEPDQFVLEGVFASVLRHCEEPLRAAINKHRPVRSTNPVRMLVAALGDRAPLLGAAEAAIYAFLNELSPHVERFRMNRPE